MRSTVKFGWLAAAALAGVAGCAMMPMPPGPAGMSFFVTSANPGRGGDLGGLEGADRHCQALAQSAGAGHRTWRAYLSTQAPALNSPAFVNARDRIGNGPWQNAKGVVVARNVDDLHSAGNNITKETALDEQGRMVNGRTESPNKHDILTGSRPDGTAYSGGMAGGAMQPDMTCGNWTKGTAEGSAMTGHSGTASDLYRRFAWQIPSGRHQSHSVLLDHRTPRKRT